MKSCKRCNGLGVKFEAITIPNVRSFRMEVVTIKTTCKACYGKGMK